MTAWKTAALAATTALLASSCGDRTAESGRQQGGEPPAAAAPASSPATAAVGTTDISARVVLSDSGLSLSAASFAPGQVTLLVRNDGTQPELLRVEGSSYRYPPAGQTATLIVPQDSVVYALHLAPGTYRLQVDGSSRPPTSFVVR